MMIKGTGWLAMVGLTWFAVEGAMEQIGQAAAPPISAQIAKPMNAAKGSYNEISTLVVPPGKDASCPAGRVFLNQTQMSRYSYRDLDCDPTTPACALKPGVLATGAPVVRHPVSKSKLPLGADGSCVPAGSLGSCWSLSAVSDTLKATCANTYSVYNDSIIVRTTKGRILQVTTELKYSAPTYPIPTLSADNSKIIDISCNDPSNMYRSILMVKYSDDCGATYREVAIDPDGKALPGGGAVHYEVPVTATFTINTGADVFKTMTSKVLQVRGNSAPYGIDRNEIYVDPYTGKIFITTTMITPVENNPSFQAAQWRAVLFVSSDEGKTWSIADLPPLPTAGLVMTSETFNGQTRLFILGPDGIDHGDGPGTSGHPKVVWYDIGGATVTRLGSANVPYYGANGPLDVSAIQTNASSLTAARNLVDLSISRATADANAMRLRVAYPHGTTVKAHADREDLAVVQVAVPISQYAFPCDGNRCVTTTNLDYLVPSANYIALIFPHFIDSSPTEYVPPATNLRPDASVLKYVEWSPLGTTLPHAKAYYGASGIANDVILSKSANIAKPIACSTSCAGAAATSSLCTACPKSCYGGACAEFLGDYAKGAFFVRPPSYDVPRFLVPWQQSVDSSAPGATSVEQVDYSEVIWGPGFLPKPVGATVNPK